MFLVDLVILTGGNFYHLLFGISIPTVQHSDGNE
jgi:hypothetical protein